MVPDSLDQPDSPLQKKNKLKILFTGSIYVGKTTLLQSFEQTSGIGIVREVARELLDKDPDIINKPTFQDILFSTQVKRENEAARANPVVICDRGALDEISHSLYYGHTIKPQWIEWLATYDLIFLFDKSDIELDPSAYPQGVDWHAFREALHQYTLEALETYSLSFTMLSGSVAQRRRTVEKYIDKLFSLPEQQIALD